jgi:glycine amidinotransferase
MGSDNGYSKLHEVIVGRELELNDRSIDFTFKHFYKTNLNHSVYEQDVYHINKDILQKRIYDLDNLSSTIEKLGVKVYRPTIVDKVQQVVTPQFKSELSSASNVRDLSIVIDDIIIETPTYVTGRYFENQALYDIFAKQDTQWITAPKTIITEDTIDLDAWDLKRDYTRDMSGYTMAIDGAQFLRVHDKIVVNISSYNHYLGYLWIKKFFPNKEFFEISVVDNHIDGAIVQLNSNTFLVNPKYKDALLKQIPWLKNYRILVPEQYQVRDVSNKINLDGQLASSLGMDINVLSVSHDTVLVNKEAYGTIKVLEQNGFTVVPIELDNCEIFGGGIHCSTLDLRRSNGT